MPKEEFDQKKYLMQLDSALYKILEADARERLNNIRLVNLEKYIQVAGYLVNFVQTGKMKAPVDDKSLKSFLQQVNSLSRDYNIVRK